MEVLEWTEAISIENQRIDDQHKKLIEITNKLIEHSYAHAQSVFVSDTLNELRKYTEYHFHEEEMLLSKVGYPKLEEHKREHLFFLRKITFLCQDVVEGKDTVTQELIDFLVKWIKTHTSKSDMDYKKYLNQI